MSAPKKLPAPRPAFRDSFAARTLGGLALVAGLLAAYANSFRVPFLFDDFDSIPNNATLHSLATAWHPPAGSGITVSGRPLLNLSLALNRLIGGPSVFSYHLGNFLLHTLAAFTLWAVLRRTFQKPAFAPRYHASATWLASTAAALWALHPLLTAAVTYTIQRAEVLVGCCYLLTLYGFIRATEKSPASRRWSLFTVLACLAGMAAKEVMASAPLIVFLYDRTFVSGSFAEAWRRHRKLHLALAATWLLLLACVLQSGGRGNSVGFIEIAWWEYALTQAAAITRYLWLTLWPAALTFDYGPVLMLKPAVLIPCGLLILGLLAATAWSLRRSAVLGFAGAWFFLILAPTSSIVPVITQTVAEHRMYLPLAAVIALVVALTAHLPRICSILVPAVLLLAAGLRTHARNHDYHSPLSLWQQSTRTFAENPRAFYNTGVILFEQNQFEPALASFRQALALVPDYPAAQHNLGYTLLALNRPAEAVNALARAVALVPASPAYRASLTDALLAADRLDDALVHHRASLTPAAFDQKTLTALTNALTQRGRSADAIALLEETLRLHPGSVWLHSTLGLARVKNGRATEGIRDLERALQLSPQDDDVRYALAAILATHERYADAVLHYEFLAARHPDADIFDMLGMLKTRLRHYSEARACFQKALTLDPAHPNAKENLAQLEAFLNRPASP